MIASRSEYLLVGSTDRLKRYHVCLKGSKVGYRRATLGSHQPIHHLKIALFQTQCSISPNSYDTREFFARNGRNVVSYRFDCPTTVTGFGVLTYIPGNSGFACTVRRDDVDDAHIV